MGIEQRCGNCFFAAHYSPGDMYETRDGGEVEIGKEFYERQCVTGVGRFFCRLVGDDFNPVVLAGEDDGCVTRRFMEE